jgi:predicted RND superfamily exporter protein
MFLKGLEWFLVKIAILSSRHPAKVLIFFSIFTTLTGIYASHISIDPAIQSLIPQKEPVAKQYIDTEIDLMPTEFMIQVIEIPPNLPVIAYRKFIRQYQKHLGEIPELDTKRLNIDNILTGGIRNYISQHGLMLMPEDSLLNLSDRLSFENIQQNIPSAINPHRPYLWTDVFDPLNLTPVLRGLIPLADRVTLDISNEFFITEDPHVLFFVVGSDWPWEWDHTKKIVDQAKQIEKKAWDEVMPEVKRLNPTQNITYPHITWVGKAMDVLRMAYSIWDAFIKTMLYTPLMIAVIFYPFFRRVRSLILAYIPLLVGLVWSFALAHLVVGKLNMLSVICGPILLGIGIDFPSYLLNQFYRRRRDGFSLEEAILITWRETGKAVIFGVFTCIVAFVALLGSRLPAFRDIGFIASTGLFLTVLAILVLLPALLAVFERAVPARELPEYPKALIRFPLERPKTTLITSLLIFGGLSIFLIHFRFESAFKEAYYMIRQPAEASSETDRRFSSLLGSSLTPFRLIIEGSSLPELLEKNESIAVLLHKYQDSKLIAFFDSLNYWLPRQAQQDRIAQLLAKQDNLDPAVFSARYDEASSGIPKDRSFFSRQNAEYKSYGKILAKFLQGRAPTDLEQMKAAGLKVILDHYLVEKNGRYLLNSYVYLPRGDYPALKQALINKLNQESLIQSGAVRYTSEEGVIDEIRRILSQEAVWLGGLVVLWTFVILFIAFRSVKISLLTLIPMTLGGIAAGGAYTLVKGDFSIFNILWVPVYIGMATDDALNIGLFLKNESQSLKEAVGKVGNIIALTSLTTMVGFGSFFFTNIEMLKRISFYLVIAMGMELIASLVLLPALFKITKIKKF